MLALPLPWVLRSRLPIIVPVLKKLAPSGRKNFFEGLGLKRRLYGYRKEWVFSLVLDL